MIDQIHERLHKLLLALKYCSEKTAMLSTVQRMSVNQERGHLMRELSKIEENPDHQIEWFGQPQKIESQLITIDRLITETGWTPPKPKHSIK